MRVRRSLFVIALLAALAPALPARAAATERIVLIWTVGLEPADLLACDELPALCALGRDGQAALLSTRTESNSKDPRAHEASAGLTVAAGSRYEASVTGSIIEGPDSSFLDAVLRDDVTLIRFTDALPSPGAGLLTVKGAVNADRALGALGGLSPAQTGARLVIVDAVRPAFVASRAEVYDDHDRTALRPLDREVGRALASDATVYLVSAAPDPARVELGIRLGLVARRGGGAPGLLTSGTTRQAGVIGLTDLLPTMLRDLGEAPPKDIEGRAAVSEPASNPARILAARDVTLTHAALARHPLTRRAMILAIAAVVFAFALVWAGVGRAHPLQRLPKSSRSWASALLLSAAAGPIVIYAEGVYRVTGVISATFVCLALVLALGVGGRALVGWRGALLFIAALSAVVPTIDLLVGAPLAWRSPWAFQIAGGGRFYGVDEGVLGLILGGAIVAAGILVDRAHLGRRPTIALLVGFAGITYVLSAPTIGSKFGAPLTAVPVAGAFLVAAAGKRFTRMTIIAIAVATVAVTMTMIGLDRLTPRAEQSHVARVTEGQTDVGEILARKISAQIRITLTTIWTRALLVFALALGLLRWKRPDAWHRGLWGHPGIRAALMAGWVGVVTGGIFNDGGVVTAAPLLLPVAVAVLLPMVEPDRNAPA